MIAVAVSVAVKVVNRDALSHDIGFSTGLWLPRLDSNQ